MVIRSFLFLVLAIGLGFQAHSQTLDFSKVLAAQKLMRSRCDVQETTYEMPGIGTPPYPVKIVRTKWTGGCVDGVLDGEGTLVLESRPHSGTPEVDKVRVDQETGLMLKGKQVGPWRIDVNAIEAQVGAYFWMDGATPGLYVRQADGSFQQVELLFRSTGAGAVQQYLEPLRSMAPISALHVEQHIRNVRLQLAGGTKGSLASQATGLFVESTLLQDLLQGNKARSAASSALGNTKEKRLLIVLSSNSLRSLDALDAFKGTVLQYRPSQPWSGPASKAAMDISQAADKKKLIDGLTSQLRSRFASVRYTDDLSNFKKTDADLVLVFDFTFKHQWPAMVESRLAELSKPEPEFQKAQLTAAPSASVGASAFVLNSDLEVVRSVISAPRIFTLRSVSDRFASNAAATVVREERLQAGLTELASALRDAIGGSEFIDIGGAKMANSNSVLWALMFDLSSPLKK